MTESSSNSEDLAYEDQAMNSNTMDSNTMGKTVVLSINPQAEQMDEAMDNEMDEKEGGNMDQDMDEKVDEEMEEKTDEIPNEITDEQVNEKMKIRMAENTRQNMDGQDWIQRLQECHDELTKVNDEVIKVREAQALGKERFDTKAIDPNDAVFDSKLVETGEEEAEALKGLTRLYLWAFFIVFPSPNMVLCRKHAA
ncbi:MAG: hypothetical protein Q9184_001207 [Pyrenodesmia sp. 2 TL-2023]